MSKVVSNVLFMFLDEFRILDEHHPSSSNEVKTKSHQRG